MTRFNIVTEFYDCVFEFVLSSGAQRQSHHKNPRGANLSEDVSREEDGLEDEQ